MVFTKPLETDIDCNRIENAGDWMVTSNDLYDEDILLWSERQAALLQRAAGGEGLREEEPDWPHIVDEIAGVGRSQLSAVRYLLVQALLNDLKAEAWPLSQKVSDWQAEARGFRGDAAEAITPSMRRRIDIAKLYRRALDRVPDSIDGRPPLPVSGRVPLTLDDLLAGPPEI
jgi:hypothetical protein